MTYHTQGFILKNQDAGEADVLVTILSEDWGKIYLYAQGIRKVESKLRGHIQPLLLSRFSFVATRSRWRDSGVEGIANGFRLTGADVIEYFPAIRRHFAALALTRVSG